MYRHIIRVLLTVVCLTLLASAAIADGEVDNPRPLTLNSPMQLDILEDETFWLSYTPDKTATYHFISEMDGDPKCTLYEGDTENNIASMDDLDEDDYNFHLEYKLTEGIQYYFAVNALEDSLGTVTLTKESFSVSPVGEQSREVEYGAQVTLAVEVDSDSGDELSYLWTDENGEPLEGDNTGNQYVIESFTSSLTFYYCHVSVGETEKYVEFWVWFSNHLQAEAENDTLTVYADAPAVLKVIASHDHGDLSYRWSYAAGYEYEYDDDLEEDIAVPILEYLAEGGNELTVTSSDVPMGSSRTYYCDVSDDFGGSVRVEFQVNNNNALTAEEKGNSPHRVPLHGEITLEAEVSIGRGSYTCEWFTADDDGNEFPIQGATTEKLVLTDVTEPGDYHFRVTDEYENTAETVFEVQIDNSLTLKPVGITHLSVPNNQDVTLEVQASCLHGEIHIVWTEWNDDVGEDEELGTGPSVTLQITYGTREITCSARDDYGNSALVEFTVESNNFLRASTPTEVTLNYGEKAQLGVEIIEGSRFSSDDLEYYWAYEDENGDWYDMATDEGLPTLTTDSLSATTIFRCSAYNDDEGLSEEVYFLVNVEEPDYSKFSHNLKMFINTFGGIPSNPTEGNYYYNVDGDNTRIHRYNVFRYVVIENRDEMKKKLNGEPVWSIKRLSGTVSLEIANSQFGESNIAYQLCVRGTPENEETAKYLVRCIWGTEMWEQEFTIHFVDLTDNQPEAVEFLGAGDHWVETVGQLFTMEENFGFRDHWTPAAGQTIIVSYGSRVYPNPIYDVIKSKSASDGSWKYFANTPGIYNFHAVITFGNIEVWHPVTLYVLQKNGLLADGNTLNLPSGLKKIEPNAFEKTAEEIVVIPDGCTEIGSEAFAYSANLKQVVLPASVTGIDPTAFDECEEVVAIVSADASADAAADAAEAAGLIVLRK